MLIERLQKPKVIERNVRRNGRLFSVRVAVVDIDGRQYARVIDATEIQSIASAKKTCSEKLYLCGDTPDIDFVAHTYTDTSTVSPYFDLNFFTSQMTRAPSFA